jgi:prepilin-type N-terminal cleavage/methylation domain-containing protein
MPGFTLIETIVALVAVAVVAAMMATYFGTSISQSSTPISRLQASGKLNRIMEKITAAYTYPHWSAATVYGPNTIIIPTMSRANGLKYATASGGTSSSAEPVWPLTGTVADGSITWTQNGAAPTLINQAWIPNKQYSANTVIVNGNYQYITPNGGTSGSTQPSWGTAATWTATESSGTGVQWKYRCTPAPTVILRTLIGEAGTMGTTATDVTAAFGSESLSYRVLQNSFIKFTGTPATEQNINNAPTDPDYGKFLKVTIGLHSMETPRTDETLTTLFVRR